MVASEPSRSLPRTPCAQGCRFCGRLTEVEPAAQLLALYIIVSLFSLGSVLALGRHTHISHIGVSKSMSPHACRAGVLRSGSAAHPHR